MATSPNWAEYDPFMPLVVEGDPSRLYDDLRQHRPRLFLHRYNAWFFTTFDDLWSLSKAHGLSVAGGITPSQLLLGRQANNFMVSQMDPPDHRKYRGLLNPLFTASAARELADAARAHAIALLTDIKAQGGGDLLMDYAGPMAVAVGCWLSGLPREDLMPLLKWTNQFFHRDVDVPGDTHVGAQAAVEFIAYINDIMRDVRSGRRTGAGAMQILLEEQKRDPRITDDHIVFIVLNLQIGAGDTVPKGIAAAFHRLWENPAERATLLARPDLALAAFHEAIRLDMPTQMQGRTALETIHHDGIEIAAGQRAMFMFAAANRDPAEFPDPHTYRVDRANRRTLAFGNGIHRCLGSHTAEMEGRIALEEALRMLPNYDVTPAESSRHKTEYVKGWSKLLVTV